MSNTPQTIGMNLSDGFGCYGRPVPDKPGYWWLRRTYTLVYVELDAVAPPEIRQQAEQALAAGGWSMGGVIEVQYR